MRREAAAYAYCLSLTALYVLSLYMVPRRVRALSRDDPLHICWRLAAATLATLASVPACYFAIGSLIRPPYEAVGAYDLRSFLIIIGFRVDSAMQCTVVAIALMTIFYMGPIVTYLLYFATSCRYDIRYDGHLTLLSSRKGGAAASKGLRRNLTRLYYERVRPHCSLITLRAIVFAPVSEEIVFRALMLPVLAMASEGSGDAAAHSRLALLCPAFFALAHLHHMYEKVTKSGMSLRTAAAGTLLQAAYTGVFGHIACLLFLRSGSVVTPVVSHIYCNYMGLPDLSFVEEGKELSFLRAHRVWLLLLHALGVALFAFALAPLTQPLAQAPLHQEWEAAMWR